MLKFRYALMAAAAVSVAAGPAGAERRQQTTCAQGRDVRTVSVAAPGLIGAACDVSYVQDQGAYESIPFHANAASDACDVPAAMLVRELSDQGFACEGPLTLVAIPEPTLVAAAASPAGGGDMKSDEATSISDRAAIETGAAPAGAADGGPVNLTAALSPVSLQRGVSPRRGMGRLSGGAARVVEASPAPMPEASAPVQIAAQVVVAAKAPVPATKTPDTSIRSTPGVVPPEAGTPQRVLAAQVEAWNAGDLNSFMDGYWKSDELTFVSGTKVMRGWDATMARYKKRYGDDAASMGRLAFEKLDVASVSDDVSVVVGRFELARDGETSGGAFTLVMRKFDGAWRIVHDHTAADE
ncbi:MAG: nuclear transport factor 2 family protein [Pseudomonadota bacterium]